MYEGIVGTSGLIMWSRNDEMCSVGLLHPLTMGLIPRGVLCSFLRKYMCCVLTLLVGCVGKHVCVCVYVACFFNAVYNLSYAFGY